MPLLRTIEAAILAPPLGKVERVGACATCEESWQHTGLFFLTFRMAADCRDMLIRWMCTERARVPCVKSRGANALGIHRLSHDRNSCDRWRLRRHTNYQQLRLLGYDRCLCRARWREAIKTDRNPAEKPKLAFSAPITIGPDRASELWPPGVASITDRPIPGIVRSYLRRSPAIESMGQTGGPICLATSQSQSR
jgi:hypothetical protein